MQLKGLDVILEIYAMKLFKNPMWEFSNIDLYSKTLIKINLHLLF